MICVSLQYYLINRCLLEMFWEMPILLWRELLNQLDESDEEKYAIALDRLTCVSSWGWGWVVDCRWRDRFTEI